MARTLLATTRLRNKRIRVYVDSALRRAWAYSCPQTVYVSPALLKKSLAFQAEVLLHEFVHVVEYCSSDAELSPANVAVSGNADHYCTRLAQTMQKRLTPLLLGLEFRQGAVNPFHAAGHPGYISIRGTSGPARS